MTDAALELLVALAPDPLLVREPDAPELVIDAVTLESTLLPDTWCPFPTVDVVWQLDEDGAAWADGVDGWPWENVDPLYTPIGSPLSPWHDSKTPAL